MPNDPEYREKTEAEYRKWLEYDDLPEDLRSELEGMSDAAVKDAFYRDLAFGTGGLRGILGAGTNRMNVFTVAKASQGLANHVNAGSADAPSIAVAFDSRKKSAVFARTASCVFAANGIRAYLFPEIMPTPCLSFAVRELGCSAGIVITASHNPSDYNGYKVYGADGCQITTEAAADILAEIEKVDIFEDVKSVLFMEGLVNGMITNIDDDVYTSFIGAVRNQSVLYGDDIDRDVAIVYTPLNGTGLGPVTRVLTESGFTGITVVEEQRWPDGNFPTCPCPDPGMREAMEPGLKYCEKTGADLLLATDPDADRCGIAVRDGNGYRLLSGNETGLLLLDFICSQRQKHCRMPAHPVFVKTIVTTDLAEKIADHYGAETVNVLTGFKFIGEVIGKLEAEGRGSDYICGFEESFGYLTGTYVRDKDAVGAAFMICEMFAYYKKRGISLTDKLEEIYRTFGYCMNTLHSYQFEGASGMLKMQEIMAGFRSGADPEGGLKVRKILDYIDGLDGLPGSDVIKFVFEDGSSAVIRPSGTEPKLKMYISIMAEDRKAAEASEEKLTEELERHLSLKNGYNI